MHFVLDLYYLILSNIFFNFKKKALEDLGYKCEIWVYDRKGVRIERI